MSSTVKSYGFVALLNNPLNEEEREELAENLYDNKSGLKINYEGTVVYIDFNQHADYSVRENIYTLDIGSTTPEGQNRFIQAISENGLSIVYETIQPYSEIWYNGSDSCIDLITAEQFLEVINKE